MWDALENPLTKLAENSPVLFVMILALIVMSVFYSKSLKAMENSYDKWRKDIKENNDKTLETMKKYYKKYYEVKKK